MQKNILRDPQGRFLPKNTGKIRETLFLRLDQPLKAAILKQASESKMTVCDFIAEILEEAMIATDCLIQPEISTESQPYKKFKF